MGPGALGAARRSTRMPFSSSSRQRRPAELVGSSVTHTESSFHVLLDTQLPAPTETKSASEAKNITRARVAELTMSDERVLVAPTRGVMTVSKGVSCVLGQWKF